MYKNIHFSPLIAGVMRWGIWGAKMNAAAMADMIAYCIDQGVNTFDHADIYGDYTTEEDFGKALLHSGIPREKIKLITKCGIMRPCSTRPEYKVKQYNTSFTHIVNSAENSLKNLKTDYLDVLLIHRPSPVMDYEVIAQAFSLLSESGKVMAFGVSNFQPHQTDALARHFPLITNQVELSLMQKLPFFDGTTESCIRNNMIVSAWSPLGGRALFDGSNQEVQKELTEYALSYGWTIAQLALAFLLHHPARIIPVIGTSRKEGIRESVLALNMKMRDEQWFEILKIVNRVDVP